MSDLILITILTLCGTPVMSVFYGPDDGRIVQAPMYSDKVYNLTVDLLRTHPKFQLEITDISGSRCA